MASNIGFSLGFFVRLGRISDLIFISVSIITSPCKIDKLDQSTSIHYVSMVTELKLIDM